MFRKVFALTILLLSTAVSLHTVAKEIPILNIAATAEAVHPIMNGQTVPNTTIYDYKNKAYKFHDVLKNKPTVLIFYRGGWCPYCNAQLSGLKAIEDKVIEMGYQIIALSPDSPERLNGQAFKSDLKVQVFSDKNFEATQAFGLAYFLKAKLADKYRNKLGTEFIDLDGTSKVALPVPAVYIMDTKGLVHFQYVNPNYAVRLEADLLFQATKIMNLAN